MSKFQLGDRVRLKSGGPTMTVSMIPAEGYDHCDCMWFAVSHYAEEGVGKSRKTFPVYLPEPSYRAFSEESLEKV